MNNAFIATTARPMTFMGDKGWSRTPMPPMLRADLLRTAKLHLTTEFEGIGISFRRRVGCRGATSRISPRWCDQL